MFYFAKMCLDPFITYWALPILVMYLILKRSPIAMNAFKETYRQPYFIVLVFISVFLIGIVANLPLFTFQDDELRMVRDMGLTTATLCALIIALFSASTTVTDEIDKKTAMTVLSKPVTRGRFIVGKYFGIVATAGFAVLLVGILFILIMNHFTVKPMTGEYLSSPDPLKRQAVVNRLLLTRIANFRLMSQGLFLAFLHVSVLTAISVAIATRARTVVNVVLCSLVYIVGHMGNWLLSVASDKGFGFLRRAWPYVYTVVPNLENYNVTLTLGAGKRFETTLIDSFVHTYYLPAGLAKLIPQVPDFLLANLVYSVAYVIAVLILAVVLMHRREIG